MRNNAGDMIVFPIAQSGQRLIFSSAVLEHFARHQQRRWWHREAGGQLFARLTLPDIIIEEATGPRRSDYRSRYGYRPNRRAEQTEITARHAQGLHFIGDWHTHPEATPSPSIQDTASMIELVKRSKHAFNGFVLTIVGQNALPTGLGVWVYNTSDGIQLTHETVGEDGAWSGEPLIL
jgi:integrative and conjugative element protein (TIGR02256 family)